MGPSIIKYAKKVVLKKLISKPVFFQHSHSKDIKNLFKYHFEIIKHFIEFIVN